MEEFQVKILASDHPFYEGKCYSLVIPTLRGMYGIHAHHSNMITAIIPGHAAVPDCTWRATGGRCLQWAGKGGKRRGADSGRHRRAPRGDRRQPSPPGRRRGKGSDFAEKEHPGVPLRTGKSCQSAQPPGASRGAANNDKNPPYQLVWYGGFLILNKKNLPLPS